MSGSHIFLVGFMGAGKSTVGALMAARLARPLIDLDERIEHAAGRSVSEIFESEGEDAFRALEADVLAAVEDEQPSVIACGGGVVVRPENRATLKRLGTVAYLEVTAGEALARVGDAATRPLLAGAGGAIAATTLLQAREALYRSVADVTISTTGRTAEQVADSLVDTLEECL